MMKGSTHRLGRSDRLRLARRRAGWIPMLAVAAGVAVAGPAVAQSALERPPNLTGAWVGRAGVGYFHFVHRFSLVGDVDKVINSPSFLLAAGLPGRVLAGLGYASNSDVGIGAKPNEWELFARWQPLDAGPVRWTAQAGYNTAAESVDGELAARGDAGPVSLFGAVRGLSHPFGADDARLAVAGGAVWRVGRWVALGGDVASLADRTAREKIAWSAGVLLGIPYTPHTLSLHATNANTGTLQGSSRGGEEVRWGFEFTVPVTLSRYFGRGADVAARPEPALVASRSDTIQVTIQGLEYRAARIEIAPGTTVVWTNRDPLAHTVTGDDGRWGSESIEPDAVWSYTFTEPGTYPFHCAPHPFMKGVVVVRP